MANEIVTEIRLELDKFRADLKDAQKAGESAGKKAAESMGGGVEAGLGRAFGGLKSTLAAIGASLAGAFALKGAISAAVETEEAVNRLNSALALSGAFTEASSAQFQKLAVDLQKTTTAADDVVLAGIATIAMLGKLSGEPLERATKASLDLAAALNIDATTAFELMGKAAAGNAGALGRYGIQIKKTGDDAADFARTLKAVEDRFGGLAQLQTNTFAGAMKQAQNAFGDVLEEIGNVIIKSPTVIALLKLMRDTFDSLAKSITKFAEGRDVIGDLADMLVEFGHNLVTFVVAPLELAFNVGQIAFNGFKTLIQGLIVVLSTGVGYVTGLLAPLGGKFAETNQAVQDFTASSAAVLDDFANKTTESADGIFNFDASAKAEGYIAEIENFVATVAEPTKNAFGRVSAAAKESIQEQTAGISFDAFSTAFKSTAAKMVITAESLAKQVNGWIVQGIGSSFSALGGALVKGENAFDAFGKAVIGALGDMLIQFGTMLVAIGIGLSTVPFLFGLQGPAAVAAGVAALVLGGALKALSGGGGGATASAGGGAAAGGGVASAQGTGGAPALDNGTQFQETLRGDVGSRIEVNVAGGVFGDKRQAGLEIADAINEAFGSNGVSLATAGA